PRRQRARGGPDSSQPSVPDSASPVIVPRAELRRMPAVARALIIAPSARLDQVVGALGLVLLSANCAGAGSRATRPGIGNLEWRAHKLNLVDCPGFSDFAGEVVGALRAVEAAMVVVGANSGVAVGTESAWELLSEKGEPRLVVINKMDKEHANFTGVLS